MQVAVELLYHGADHLTNLIVKEALSAQIEMDEFERVWILRIRHAEVLRVDVHVVVGTQLEHVPLGGLLVRIHVLRVVVVLLSALEGVAECLVHELLPLLRQPVAVYLVNKLRVC